METCTAGSASGLEKRTSGNADTALQADSTNRRTHPHTPADDGGHSSRGWRRGCPAWRPV